MTSETSNEFDSWLQPHRQILDELGPAAADTLRAALHSAWLEDAAPTADQIQVLARQVRGDITGDQARATMLAAIRSGRPCASTPPRPAAPTQ